MNIERHALSWALCEKHLHGRMSFIAGPRQVGKTTAVQKFLQTLHQERHYYNWDSPTVKRRFAKNPAFFLEDISTELPRPWVALDEIHKYPKWKNILKGYFDEWKNRFNFVVTGSARLDFFRQSGDSLVGRYFFFRMLPLGLNEIMGKSFSLNWSPGQEITHVPTADTAAFDGIQSLLHLSGFPEPFTIGTADFALRWRDQHASLIIHEDLRDISRIDQIGKLETLMYLLPERVGNPLSLNALKQILECAHASIVLWLEALKKVYLIFSLSPWTTRLSRSVRKEEKYYFWDWGMVEDLPKRFENFIAVQLQRAVSAWNELGKGSYRLYYLRTKDGLEVDFAIADRKKVRILVEVKLSEESLSSQLVNFQERTGADIAIQVIHKRNFCLQKSKNTWIMSADRLLALLP